MLHELATYAACRTIVFALPVILSAGLAARASEPSRGQSGLFGSWVVEFEEAEGLRRDGDMGKHGCWIIDRNGMRQIRWSSGWGHDGSAYRLEVDEATPENGVNLRYIAAGVAADGRKRPDCFLGIYELSKDGHALKFCWDRSGAFRPTRFETAKESERRVLVLKRLPRLGGIVTPYDVDEKGGTAKMRMRMSERKTDEDLGRIGNPDKVFGVHMDRKDSESNHGKGYWGPLTTIDIPTSAHVTDSGISAISQIERLEAIDIRGVPITGSGFAALNSLKHLQSVSIEQTHLDDAGVATLATLPQLQRLRISAPNKITAKGLAHLRDFAALRHFDFNQSSGFEKDLLPFGDAEVKHLERLENLQSLHILPASLTDTGFASLAKIGSLESLSLYGCRTTPTGLAQLSELKKLRSLSLVRAEVDDACLGEIARLPLEELLIEPADATDAGLEKLAECSTLRKLVLYAGYKSAFGDDGIERLAGLKELTHLRIHCNRLTQASLRLVEHLPKIEVLSITSSLVKVEMKQGVRTKFPRVIVD